MSTQQKKSDPEHRKGKSVPMTVGNDPALWRYHSVDEAIATNIDLIVQLIQAGEQADQQKDKVDVGEKMD
jgi:hypothetical protein